MPAVSVVVPVYNSEKYLSSCIESILCQTFEDIELILVNDGSTDSSLTICNSYQKDPRVIVLDQVNSGVSASRNNGISIAEGTWITFVDSDDFIEPDLIQNLINSSYDVDFSFTGMRKVYSKNGVVSNTQDISAVSRHYDKQGLYLDLGNLLDNCMLQGPCSKLFKNEIVSREQLFFPLDMSYGEDSWFVYNYIKHVNSAACINGFGYHYNVELGKHNSLNTTFRVDKFDVNIFLFDILKESMGEFMSPAQINEILDERLRTSYISYMGELLASKKKHKQKIQILKNINANPIVERVFSFDDITGIQNKFINLAVSKKLSFVEFWYFALKEKIRKYPKIYSRFAG